MVVECVNLYQVIDRPDGGVDIHIQVPKRFASLWLVRLGELQTSEAEIAEYED